MLSINTNTSSLIAQNSMKSSTNKLNQAIERMTTGAKINHAKDNAANYSIATNMTTKINAYQIAEDNCAMGLDLISTASSSLEQMSDLTSRLRSLATQAQNGTYGSKSLDAINTEAQAIIDELYRIKNTTQYNGINLFDDVKKTVFTRRDTSEMTPFSSVDENARLSSGTYSISTADELAKLSKMTNNSMIGENIEFVLANNIDLSKYSTGEGWTPIGDFDKSYNTRAFKAQFDGNGYVISNLYINRPDKDFLGLFGYIGSSSTIQNLEMRNINIIGKSNLGAISGSSHAFTITNSSVQNCDITGEDYIGGLIGSQKGESIITDCYTNVKITGTDRLGGIFGEVTNCIVENCYSNCDIDGQNYTGGLVGNITFSISINNSYVIGNITGHNYSGGLIGRGYNTTISDSYATGDIIGTENVGGIAGMSNNLSTITNTYATGSVSGTDTVGGLVGYAGNATITNSFATSNVTGLSKVGGLIGYLTSKGKLTNCYENGNVNGSNSFIGGLIGLSGNEIILKNCYATGKTSGTNTRIGGLLGYGSIASAENSYCSSSTGQTKAIGEGTISIGNIDFITTYELNNLISRKILPKFNFTNNYSIDFQVGINSSSASQLSFKLSSIKVSELDNLDMSEATALEIINSVLKKINEEQATYGAIENRLMSALEQIHVSYDNLVSSRSTIQDADIAEVSSEYIKMQILQQASATLMATANQSPAIALQLL